ncbi:MAG TPA: PIN domain-containing protein [Bryobacteraceae bacterium]
MNAVGDGCFVDTNVLLYSFDPADPLKHELAKRWVAELWSSSRGRLSWQVLNEFYANAARKLKMPGAAARDAVKTFALWQPLGFDMGNMQRAWYWMDRAGVSYWDGLILGSAEELGCRWLLSEDFQAGRKYGSVQVVNPFETDPAGF